MKPLQYWSESLWLESHFQSFQSHFQTWLYRRIGLKYDWSLKWPSRVLETHLIGFVCDSWVVLNLPETLSEAFPLFCFSKLFLMFIVREQIVGPQECPAGPGYRWITSDYCPRSTYVTSGSHLHRWSRPLGLRRDQKKRSTILMLVTYVSWVPKKKTWYLLEGDFTAPSGSSSICRAETAS